MAGGSCFMATRHRMSQHWAPWPVGCSQMDLLHLLCIFALPVFCIVNVKKRFVFFQRSVQELQLCVLGMDVEELLAHFGFHFSLKLFQKLLRCQNRFCHSDLLFLSPSLFRHLLFSWAHWYHHVASVHGARSRLLSLGHRHAVCRQTFYFQFSDRWTSAVYSLVADFEGETVPPVFLSKFTSLYFLSNLSETALLKASFSF